MLSEHLKKYAETAYRERAPYFGSLRGTIEEKLLTCTEEEKVLMQFFYGTMPLSDAAEYPFDLFLSYVRHGLMLRREIPWCRELPEEVFLRHVLYYRVNSEKIEDCRPFFYQDTIDRIKGLSMREAVIELNYYAAEHVSYRASDLRTLSPLTVYASGDGRCGEESAFFVSVLRSVGIPARQVYVPLWAHCDDNHAWCEVRLSDGWHYLGACEPEEVLDRGWFDGAASRALLIHAREFDQFHPEKEEMTDLRNSEAPIGRDQGVFFVNRTPGYADTARVTVSVREGDQPAAGASICIQILNYAEFFDSAVLTADAEGMASIRLGKGSCRIRAGKDGKMADAIVTVEGDQRISLSLSSAAEYCRMLPVTWTHHELPAPQEHVLFAAKPTKEEQIRQRQRLEKCSQIRNSVVRRTPFEGGGDPKRERFLQSLSEKDRKDVTETIYQDAELAENIGYPEELFQSYVYCERIGREELTPWRAYLRSFFDDAEKQAFKTDPYKIASYVESHVSFMPQYHYDTLVSSPKAVLTLGQGSTESRAVLCVAIARALNLPARLSPVTGAAEYYDRATGAFTPFLTRKGRKDAGAAICLDADGADFSYGQNWTIARFSANTGTFDTLRLEGQQGSHANGTLSVTPGIYRIVTVSRDPKGNLHEEELCVQAEQGRKTHVSMKIAPIRTQDLIVQCAFEDFTVMTSEGAEASFFSLQNRPALAIFLEPGREPSEHVLNELMEQQHRFPDYLDLIFILHGREELCQDTMRSLLQKLSPRVFFQNGLPAAPAIARHLYVDNEKLPLLMLLDADHLCRYGCSGYNVGSIALSLEIAKKLIE